jgi:predicted DCC family thiol-disulfide oxidoreductase YuxK
MTEPKLTVYHDGACPLCAAEIALYRRAEGSDAVAFLDVADPGARPGVDLPRDRALARFHVREADGRLLSGAAAFAALWRTLPGWRWLGILVGQRWLLPVAELAYRARIWRRSRGCCGADPTRCDLTPAPELASWRPKGGYR